MPAESIPENAVQVTTRAQWRAWLAKHHARTTGIWLVSFKKADPARYLPYAEIVEEALCFGWIDSKPRALDTLRSMLWLAPRKPRTNWSAANKARVARLIEADLMTASGLAKVEAARRDGSWAALEVVDALAIPADLAKAFRAHRGSAANFRAFPPSTKKGILEWILNAKRPETRAARVLETAMLAARNERANQWPRK